MSTMLRVLIVVTIAGVLALASLGCAPTGTTTPSTPTTTPGTPSTPTTPSAPSAETFEWVQTCPWMAAELTFQGLEYRNALVEAASGGRLVIETHPSGALMGVPDMFDAVHNGTIDLLDGTLPTWLGKLPAADMFGGMPFGLQKDEFKIWMSQYGGHEMLMEMLSPYNIGYAQISISMTPEGLGWSNVRLDNIAAWKGLKFRTKGVWGEILQDPAVGAQVTTLASSELYSALERGILDALEYSSPGVDKALGFYEITKYYMLPGFHQPCGWLTEMVNKDAWNKLPDDLKSIFQQANDATNLEWYGHYLQADAEALAFYETLPDLEMVTCPADMQAFLHDLAIVHYEEKGANDVFFDKVYNSQREFKDFYDLYMTYQRMSF